MNWLSAPHRLAAALAAIIATTSIFSALLLSFQATSLEVWLAPTPEVMELVAGCDHQPDRQARDRCRQKIVTAQLAHDHPTLHLARR